MPLIFDLFNDEFFKNMIDFDGEYGYFSSSTTCANCGMTYADFSRTGKFGCGQCYETFEDRVPALIKRIQGSLSYEGSVPTRGNGVFKMKHQIKRLQQQLKTAVETQDFEKAMVLRDQIRELEANIEKG